jgi:predicted GNAT family acetyltransferase
MVDGVTHNAQAGRFELRVEGWLCRADYRLDGAVMNVHHTEVPPALEGRGLASKLIAAVFEHARRHALTIRPSCSYVRAWARRHPEVADLLEQ